MPAVAPPPQPPGRPPPPGGHPPPELPAGLSRAQFIDGMPWLSSWLQPARAPGTPIAARDFLRTPFGLSLLSLPPDGGAPLALAPRPQSPPAVVRRLARALFASQAGRRLQQEPLLTAVGAGDLAMVRGTLRAAELDALGEQGHLPLTLAALLGRPQVVAMLLGAGASPDGCDVLGNTALHWAAIAGDAAVAELLRQSGANGEQENLLGGRADDYRAAWAVEPPERPGIACRGRDGRCVVPPDRASFAAEMGFEYLEAARPGVDFFMQILANMGDPSWAGEVAAQLGRLEHLPREAPAWPRLFMKDFGAPWGWGVCTAQGLAAGAPVTTYVGDLVHSYEVIADLLNWGFSTYASNSMPSDALQMRFLSQLDARRSGNLGSRINSAHHPDAANLRLTCRLWRGLPQVRFFARRDIAAQEQLSWYYGDGFWRGRGLAATPLPAF